MNKIILFICRSYIYQTRIMYPALSLHLYPVPQKTRAGGMGAGVTVHIQVLSPAPNPPANQGRR